MIGRSRHAGAHRGRIVMAWACAAGAWALTVPTSSRCDEPPAGQEMRFTRVHVPRDALPDVPLGAERYVPMPRAAFEATVERTSRRGRAADARGVFRAEAARYEARIADSGRLEGRVEFDAGAVAVGDELAIGDLAVTRCTARTADGVGDAPVFSLPDGTLVVSSLGAGTYSGDWVAPQPTRTSEGTRHVLPLLPALRSSIRLAVPANQRPLLVGHDVPAQRDGDGWLIEAGTDDAIEFMLVDAHLPPPRLSAWSAIDIVGREVLVATAFAPATAWTDEPVVIEKDPALIVTAATLGDSRHDVIWADTGEGRGITVRLPPVAYGRAMPLVIHAVGPLPVGAARPLPALRPRVAEWQAGGAVLQLDPALALATVDVARCLPVTAEASASWPVPAFSHEAGDPGRIDRVLPARLHLEHESAGAEVRISVVPRTAQVEVDRATIVEFAPGVVVGVATCEVSVARGEAFDLEGTVAPGWFLDAVDVVGWSQPLPWAEPGPATDARAAEPLEWKVVRGARGDTLRIGLAAAITPGRRLRLRITGHRPGAVAGATFSGSEIDMVQFTGAAAGAAAVGFKTNAEQAVELEGVAADSIDPRLATLVDDPGVRSWAPAGGRAAAWQVRVVRRRPPLDVQAQVRLTARDDRLSQSFTFECRPDRSDLDGLVVRFSEPMDDQLEWSLLAPAAGGIVARRLESADEAWLVEFTPPVREPVTIRATRTIPLQAAVPVPLAWVEGAARQTGEVIVRDAGRRRARLVNRRLAEVPPRQGGDRWPTLIGVFSFVGERDASTPPAAELLPGERDDDARAWAWRETTSCWCHASGRTEFETTFDIESQGRGAIVIGLPAGRQLQGVEIDGTAVAVAPRDEVAALPIDLPVGRSRLRLVVRTVAPSDASRPWWRVEPAGIVVDLPVLERLCRLYLPPDLEIVTLAPAWQRVGQHDQGVVERLTGIVSGPPDQSLLPASDAQRGAFRVLEVMPVSGPGDPGTIVVVRRPVLAVGMVAVGLLVAAVSFTVAGRRPWLLPVLCVVAGVAALWSPPPADVVARSGWWAACAACLLVAARHLASRLTAVALAAAALVCGGAEAVRADDALRVFIVPGDEGETALVPEPLYRTLERASGGSEPSVRVLGCRIRVPIPGPHDARDERWPVRVEFVTSATGLLWPGPGGDSAGWVPESLRIDGQRAALTPRGVVVSTVGHHVLEVDVRPDVEPRGDVDMLTVAVPSAPSAILEIDEDEGDDSGRSRCEAAQGDGPFREIRGTWSAASHAITHDVSRANRIRVTRPRVPGAVLATTPPTVESRNVVFWELDACRLVAMFTVDSGRAIPRPCVVRADEGLELVEPVDRTLDVARLPGNRFRVSATAPVIGPLRFELAFRKPLASPAGRFHVPGAWIEEAASDVRTIRFEPAGDLAVEGEAPAPFTPLAMDEPGRSGMAWRGEVRPRPAAAAGDGGAPETFTIRPRVAVERRRQEIRGTQDVRVSFAAERTTVTLDARFDAASAPLVSVPLEIPAESVIDSIALFDDALHDPETTGRGPIEAQWERSGADRGVLTVQRPRAGRYRLDVVAHVPRPPAPTGRVPVVRSLAVSTPAVVSWNEAVDAGGPERSWELRADERPPLYSLRAASLPEPTDDSPAEPPVAPEERIAEEPRIELADVQVAIEGRGRAWGRARFDIVVRQRLLRLALPAGMRLFDLLVDGQPTATVTPAVLGGAAVDVAGERWDIRLLDTNWPRSIEVVYAGTLGGADDDGPVTIAPPTLLGLPCSRCLWTLHPPRDAVVYVAEPGRVVTPAEDRQERAAALARVGAVFDRAIAAAAPADGERLREEYEARARRFAGESGGEDDAFVRRGAVLHVVGTAPDAPLTIRIARRRDPTLPTRAWATTLILAVGGALWVGMRRRLAA